MKINNIDSTYLIGERSVSDSTSTISFSGLDGNLHGGYILESSYISASGTGGAGVAIRFNGDNTDANYIFIRDEIYGNLNHPGSGTGPWGGLSIGTSGFWGYFITDICINQGIIHAVNKGYYNWSTSVTAANCSYNSGIIRYTQTVSNLTSISMVGSNLFGSGSRFRLYKKI